MNIFIDCGFYAGIALKKYIDSGVVDNTWIVYAFDPSPDIDMKAVTALYPVPIKIRRKAVWTKAGNVEFWTSERDNAGHLDGMPAHARKQKFTVKSIDFSAFLKKLPEDAYVICSMDIEGAEFPVIEKILKDGVASRINLLDVEFHHRFMEKETHLDAERLMDELEDVGVEIKLKVPLI
jgi:FkbM family methyltransferase